MADDSELVFICFGETGAGKSTFISALGGAVPEEQLVGSAVSATEVVTSYRIPGGKENRILSIVDTPGFNDTRVPSVTSDEATSEPSFTNQAHALQLLRFLNLNNDRSFVGIFWFVNQCRRTCDMVAQARLIHNLLYQHDASSHHSNWSRVTVMLKGDGVGEEGARGAVAAVTKSETVELRFMRVGRKGPEFQIRPDEFDVLITTLPDGTSELRWPSKDHIFQAFPNSPILWTERLDHCKVCGQTGDFRAFYPCHTAVRREHRIKKFHQGPLLRVHGARDIREKWKSVGKKTVIGAAVVGGVVAPVMGAVLCAPAAVAVLPAFIAPHLQGFAMAAATMAATSDAISKTVSIDSSTPRCKIPEVLLSHGKLTRKDYIKIIKDSPFSSTLKGECQNCGHAATSSGCFYFWACCTEIHSAALETPDQNDLESFGTGCLERCETKGCGGLNKEGCVRHCIGCHLKDTPDEHRREFKKGCRGSTESHKSV
ncbi:hypothetical protein N7494_000359 [Penicillium frequentans]|uniref:G domain-containing protein n=1 Tax=Penicillium frequentans TaxID=3151616 RepID=A0AAD6GIW6_9EURO|nr:hypothetical protein N7494_000359 [Penicillium glabrum]